MNCQSIARQLAFDCTPLQGVHGEPVFELGTPFSFHDGSAICVYVVDHGGFAEISDDGLTLIHLSGLGLDPWGSRRRAVLRDRVKPYGVELRDDGSLRMLLTESQLAWCLPRFVAAELAVAEWAREQVGAPETARQLADEVEMYLRAWRPQATLTRQPVLCGISGHEYRFDFQQGNELIDVISPHHNATGGVMRKLGDVLNADHPTPPKVRVVVDDRTEPDRALVEMRIIASLATAMPLTKLIEKTHCGHA